MAYWVSIKSVWSFVVVEECSYRNKNHPLKTASIFFSTDVGEPIQRRYASAQMRKVFQTGEFRGFSNHHLQVRFATKRTNLSGRRTVTQKSPDPYRSRDSPG